MYFVPSVDFHPVSEDTGTRGCTGFGVTVAFIGRARVERNRKNYTQRLLQATE